MAVIRDVMPAFELLQPTSTADAQKLLERHGADAWVMAGGLDSFDWLKDRIKKPKVVVDLSGIEELKGVRPQSCPGSVTADPQPGHDWGQRIAGRALLVLPGRLALLPCRRQHLLCRYTRGPQPRARHSLRRPLRGRESLGFGPCSDRARRQICDAHAQG